MKRFWQTRFGRCVFKQGAIHVYQNYFFRWLTFDSPLVQTLINRKHPERPVLKYIDALIVGCQRKAGPIALLGLGGGAVVHALHARFQPQHLDIVEISADMITIARRFFALDTLPDYPIHCEDAAVYVKGAKGLQHLLIDVYQADDYPEQCLTESFFQDCYYALADDGILAINNPDPKLQMAFATLLVKVFKTTPVAIPVEGTQNHVILVSKLGWPSPPAPLP